MGSTKELNIKIRTSAPMEPVLNGAKIKMHGREPVPRACQD